MKAQGHVFKYGDNIDTDIIIPARYLNTADSKELAAHCMEPIDAEFYKNAGPPESTRRSRLRSAESPA